MAHSVRKFTSILTSECRFVNGNAGIIADAMTELPTLASEIYLCLFYSQCIAENVSAKLFRLGLFGHYSIR